MVSVFYLQRGDLFEVQSPCILVMGWRNRVSVYQGDVGEHGFRGVVFGSIILCPRDQIYTHQLYAYCQSVSYFIVVTVLSKPSRCMRPTRTFMVGSPSLNCLLQVRS